MSITDRPHVLIVGEDATLTLSIHQSLGTEHFLCSEAIGPHEALVVARRTAVDVALLDATGPRTGDPLQLAQRLRVESRDMGLVLITAHRSLEGLIAALAVGIVDVLAKPVSGDELAEVVNRAMEWREAARQLRTSLTQHEERMAEGGVRIGTTLAESGVASSSSLDACLARLYGRKRAAFEHARRVAAIARALSRSMDIAEPLLGHITRAAMLHDVGKLAIPQAILGKPWPLSSGEHAVVRAHVRVAAETLARVPFLAPTAEIVGATRERYDGRGYPDRRHSSAIPIGARIIAVADAFDTLSGGPVALSRHSAAAVNARLVRHAGSRFDPRVVLAWLRCVEDAVLQPVIGEGAAAPAG